MQARISSLDQFRGYTVLGMFLVNFLGSFAVTPALFKHHDTYCSYADTIMPHFFFAVGFAYRLTFLRRVASENHANVYRRFWRRNVSLIVLGAFIYVAPEAVHSLMRAHPPSLSAFLTRALCAEMFQTLVHIGVTALWVMPVIGAKPAARLAWVSGSAGLHLILSHCFYYRWVNDVKGIDGGLLGFLTWTIPMIAGSLAHDIVVGRKEAKCIVRGLIGWGVAAMALGYGFSCLNLVTPPNATQGGLAAWLIEPPFVPPTRSVNLWTMSQRAGTVSYLTFGAGLSLAVYAAFVWICDERKWQLGFFRTLGTNALAGYLIHIVVGWGFGPAVGRWSPPVEVLAALMLYLAVCYLCLRLLEKKGIHWRL